MYTKEIIDALREKQKSSLRACVADMEGVTSEQELMEELDTPGTTRYQRTELFSEIPVNIIKNIENARDDYPTPDFEVFLNEMNDNANDIHANKRNITFCKGDGVSIISYLDDGPGIPNLLGFLELSGTGKDRSSAAMGLAGQGAKLVVTKAVYIYTETKRANGSVEAVIWFVNYLKEKVKFIPVRPRGNVTAQTGTYTEIHLFDLMIDQIPDEQDIIDALRFWYRTDLLQNPGIITVNGQTVGAEPFPAGKEKEFQFAEGKLIIADEELNEEDRGIILNIYRKDVRLLYVRNDFSIDLEPDVEKRITGYVRYDLFKQIITVNKCDIQKRKTNRASIWNEFRQRIKAEIVKFLKENNLLVEHQIRGNRRAYDEINKDLKYLLKQNRGAKKLFDSLAVSGGVGRQTHDNAPSMPAIEEKREGQGSIECIILFSEDTEGEGLSAASPTDDFFDNDDVCAIEETAEVHINIYRKIPGRRSLIRLVTDTERGITSTGPRCTITNLPLNVPLLIKAQTTYGVCHNETLPLGRPIGQLMLTDEAPHQRVVLPIRKIHGNIKVRDDALHGDDIAILQELQDGSGQEIVFDTTHPEFKLSTKEDQEYIHRLRGVIIAVCSQVEDLDEQKRTYVDMLRTIVRRH